MVWDLFIRIFHWMLVVLIAIQFFSEEVLTIHSELGYIIMILIVGRVVWGFIGSKHARFSSFPLSFKKNITYFKGVLSGKPISYKGHNPPGAIVTILFLITIIMIIVTGSITLATIHFEGFLVPSLLFMDDETSFFIKDLHHTFTNILLFLISVHVLGVLLACFQHRKNFIKSMFTGEK